MIYEQLDTGEGAKCAKIDIKQIPYNFRPQTTNNSKMLKMDLVASCT